MATASLALVVGGCSDASETSRTDDTGSTASKASVVATNSTTPSTAECDQDAAGQVSCLVSAFDLEKCSDAKVLGSMFRANEAEGSFEHRTAFGLDKACLAELEASAKRRNFSEDDKGELVAKSTDGSREKLIIGLQISADGSVVEWERTKE